MFDSATQQPEVTAPLNVQQAIAMVSTWSDLSDTRRRDLISCLTRTAKVIGLPPGAFLLTPEALRTAFLNQSPAAFGLTDSRMRNIRSCLKAVLLRLGVIDRDDTPLTERWAALNDALPERKRAGLIAFARYCSANGIAPTDVTDDVLAGFGWCLKKRTLCPRPRKKIGEVRGAWNSAVDSVAGWPSAKLSVLRQVGQYILPLNTFPESFQTDVQAFGDRLGASDLDDLFDEQSERAESVVQNDEKKPCRSSTIETRQGHCRWAASALVAVGTPIQEITSLSCLVTPVDRAKHILQFLYHRANKQPSAGGGHVADILRIIARYHARLDNNQIKLIKKWAKPVTLKYGGMTEKNSCHIRFILNPEKEAKFLALPSALLKAARKLRAQAPALAASLALRATAIALLTSVPLRLANVVGLKMDQHLQRVNPSCGRITSLRIPPEETKNRRAIDVPVSERLSDILSEWIDNFRPLLAHSSGLYLFPGNCSAIAPITPQGFRQAVRETIKQEIGVPLTPHQFRHVAAFLYLRDNSGHYEDVRQLLGHADIRTTIKSYCGMETESAVRRYHEILEARRGAKRKVNRYAAIGPQRSGRKGRA